MDISDEPNYHPLENDGKNTKCTKIFPVNNLNPLRETLEDSKQRLEFCHKDGVREAPLDTRLIDRGKHFQTSERHLRTFGPL